MADFAGTPGVAPLTGPPSVLPADRYTDRARAAAELRTVFHPTWLAIGPSSDVAGPRDYRVWDGLGESVVVVRDDGGGLAAFHNVCQHRGAKLVRGSGTCPASGFTCPWHGFRYGPDGRLLAAPLPDSFDAAELRGLRAPAVAVEELFGLVWVCLTPPAAGLRAHLGALADQLDWYGLEAYEARYTREWEVGANWKAVLDGFLETWHVPFTHKESLGGMVRWREAELLDLDPHSMMTIPVRVRPGAPEPADPDPRARKICHYLAFPNTIFSCFPTHVQLFQAWPRGPDRSVFRTWNLFGPAPAGMADDAWTARKDRSWEHFLTVADEDLGVLDDLGATYGSLGFTRNMFNTEEGRLAAFHRVVDRLVAGG